jgi:bacillopeptidase F
MKPVLWLTLIFGAWVRMSADAGTIDDALAEVLQYAPADYHLSVIVYMEDQVDLAALTTDLDAMGASKRFRHEMVISALQEKASTAQGDLIRHLDERTAEGTVESYTPLWITNAILVRATPEEIRHLAERIGVATVFLDHPVSGAVDAADSSRTPVSPTQTEASRGPKPAAQGGGDVEPGIVAIRAPEAWALGYTGEGVVVSSIDTGVDGAHPALASRWRGLDERYRDHPAWAFFDPVSHRSFPVDDNGHGTHMMGTLCGGPPGDGIGVAPGSTWITAAPIVPGNIQTLISNLMQSFAWIADPDGAPSTDWDVPAVCSNSWGLTAAHGMGPCDERFWVFIDAVEAAGVVVLFSGDEDGQGGIRRPADRATDDYNACATTAVDANVEGWPIAHFAPRGPTECTPDGAPAIKPELSAPGINVRSSIPRGGYAYWSGMSMPTPHVAGVVALMAQANHDLTVNQIKQILYDTAQDLGDPGEDNTYGWGMVDAYEAVRMALAMSGCTREPEWVCDGDVDGDGQVNPVDAGLIQAAFGSVDEQDVCNYDVDCDGQINPVDAGIVQSLFGTCDAPRGVCP